MAKPRALPGQCTLSVGLSLVVLGLLEITRLPLIAQTTVATGSIQGTITDPTGAVIPSVRIMITSQTTGQSFGLTSSETGTYNSGALIPGEYRVKVEAKGFRAVEMAVVVQVGVTTSGSVRLELGPQTEVLTINATAERVNTEQATVQGVMTAPQIDRLPFNGRNFLELAQLEPGVQIQDAQRFDWSKIGFQAISLGGRQGRTTRIELDGIDISDETVGTTTQNIPQSAIQEFQISQSSLDLSTELTSSGAVNVVTRSGSNQIHGESFISWRSDRTAARFGSMETPLDRKQYGARLGGPLIKDKLFFFADGERTQQRLMAPVELSAPFAVLSGTFNAPFRESMAVGRLDYQAKPNWRLFYRFSYHQNRAVVTSRPDSYRPFANVNHTPVHAVGWDLTTEGVSHSMRFGYTKFRNTITDATAGTSVVNPAPNLSITIAPDFFSGPELQQPMATTQGSLQFKYDGSKTYRSHVIRFGIGVNRILGGGSYKYQSVAPHVVAFLSDATRAFASSGPFPGGDSNPLNYPAEIVIMGNGQGFFSEIPAYGFPGGGMSDTRFAWYFGDAWKPRPNITINFGVRYDRDTGRSDADLPPIDVLNRFGPGLGDRVNQPNKNFAPQLGMVWDPWKTGKTVFRAGAGLFYENTLFAFQQFSRPPRLPTGLFLGFAFPCPSGMLLLPTQEQIDTSNLCGQPMGLVAAQLNDVQDQYQAATVAAGPRVNPSYIGNALANGSFSTGYLLLAPDYRPPYSAQFNVGFQRQIRSGTVLSVDYLRNVGLHYLMQYDTNHVGDARYLNRTAALNAINLTHESFGCAHGVAGIDCALAAGTSIFDYAIHGLDSGAWYLSGPASSAGLTPDTGAAFPGINPDLGQNEMQFPIGRSVYNALQVSLRSNMDKPLRGVNRMYLQVSYALSRFESMTSDQDYLAFLANEYANVNRYFGPSGLDRTHQLSFGGVMDFPAAFRVGFIAHLKTALPADLHLPGLFAPGEIFRTDVTGDGTGNDFLPGTNVGSFGRSVKVNDLNEVIAAYNSTNAGHLTPAGQALIDAGLFTQAQLDALGAVTPHVDPAPQNQVGLDSLLTSDVRVSWVIKVARIWGSAPDSLVIEPTISIFNLFNFANYDALSGGLYGQPGSVNGTTQELRTNRIGLGSGVFALGAPRTFEFGMKLSF